jgi:hypothetical protein
MPGIGAFLARRFRLQRRVRDNELLVQSFGYSEANRVSLAARLQNDVRR